MFLSPNLRKENCQYLKMPLHFARYMGRVFGVTCQGQLQARQVFQIQRKFGSETRLPLCTNSLSDGISSNLRAYLVRAVKVLLVLIVVQYLVLTLRVHVGSTWYVPSPSVFEIKIVRAIQFSTKWLWNQTELRNLMNICRL